MRHRLFHLLYLAVLISTFPFGAAGLLAQESTSQDTVRARRYNLSEFGDETVRYFIQPTTWDMGDWLKLGAISGATFLTMQADQPVRDAVLKNSGRYYRSVPMEGGRMYGDLLSPVVFFVGFAGHSLIANDKSTRKIAYEIGQASLYTGAIVLTMKSLIGRARPHDNEGRASYRPFTFIGDDYHSLPGGHTATAFVISTVLSRNIRPTWLKVLVYVPAVLTAYSRIYQDWHWTSDCVLGGAIGYFVADWVVDLHENKGSRVHVTSIYPLTISVDLN